MTHAPSTPLSRLALLLVVWTLWTSVACFAEAEEWQSIFNGKNLDGWNVKIRHHKLGDNFANTFRVADGVMQVRYDAEQYGEFKQRFGHIFYKTPCSHYRLRLEYRFVQQQVEGGPGWAVRNSGIMVHGQDPVTMTVDQDFPASIEVQLLGGDGENKRTTGNLCTPGTHVVMDGKLIKRHCTSSTSKTYHGDQWVKCEVEVRGSKLIRHIINGETVLAYQSPQLDDATAKTLERTDNKLLDQGTISLQSESHPVDFRNIEIMLLKE